MANPNTQQTKPTETKPTETTPAPTPKTTNRVTAMFHAVTFKAASATAKEYANGDGSKGKKIANVRLEYAHPLRPGEGSGIYAAGSIKAVLRPGKSKPVPVFSFLWQQGTGSSIAADGDANAMAELDQFMKTIANVEYVNWRKAGAPVAVVEDVDAVELDGVAFTS